MPQKKIQQIQLQADIGRSTKGTSTTKQINANKAKRTPPQIPRRSPRKRAQALKAPQNTQEANKTTTTSPNCKKQIEQQKPRKDDTQYQERRTNPKANNQACVENEAPPAIAPTETHSKDRQSPAHHILTGKRPSLQKRELRHALPAGDSNAPH